MDRKITPHIPVWASQPDEMQFAEWNVDPAHTGSVGLYFGRPLSALPLSELRLRRIGTNDPRSGSRSSLSAARDEELLTASRRTSSMPSPDIGSSCLPA